MKKELNQIQNLVENLEKSFINLEVVYCEEHFSEIFDFISDMYLNFVDDEENGATQSDYDNWKENGYIEFYFTERGINYIAWTTQYEKNNQPTWTSDTWEEILENGEIEKYLNLMKII